jgi:hypothetical protein
VPAWPRPEDFRATPDPAAQSAERSFRLAVGGVALFLLGAGVLVAGLAHRHGARSESQVRTVSAGPPTGTPIPAYTTARHAALDIAHGHAVAIVSLRRYATESDARRIVHDVHVDRFLVAAPAGAPDVTADVGRWRDATARQADADAAEIDKLLPTVEDPDFRAQYERDRDAYRVTAAALRRDAPVVFGLVVDGDADAFRRIAAGSDVRVVDLAPDDVAHGGDVTGLRPEETVAAGTPPERPA